MKELFYTGQQKSAWIIALLALLPLLGGCSFFEETNQETFTIPSDGSVQHVEQWIIVQNDGQMASSRYAPSLIFETASGNFSLEMQKNCTSAVLAYPVVEGNVQKPFGAVYPYSTTLSATGGFCAHIIDRLYRGTGSETKLQMQDFVSRFNWGHFYALCAEQFPNDMWNIDEERIISKITSGKFSKNDIKIKKE